MNQDRIDFGSRLKQEREARALSLPEVARITKIPVRSLERLEDGRFEELPAEVFVRGFLRSYARVVGLDPEETVRRYGELVAGDRPKKGGSLLAVGSSAPVADEDRAEVSSAAPSTASAPASAPASASAAPAASGAATSAASGERRRPSPTEEFNVVTRAIVEASRGTRRAPLTLAVIILVIVATLTLSLLISRPSHVGDGVSQAAPVAAHRA